MSKAQENKTESKPAKSQKTISILRSITMFFRKWNEPIILLPIAMLSWCLLPSIIRWFDPTAAVYDSGVLMKFMYAVIGTLVTHFTAWIMLKLTMPTVFNYIYNNLTWDLYAKETVYKSAEIERQCTNKRIVFSIILLGLYFFSFLAVLATL